MTILLSLICIAFGLVLVYEAAPELLSAYLSRPRAVDRLIRRFAVPERAFHIHGPDGTLYMERYVLFNRGGGSQGSGNDGPVQYPWLPFSVRLHHIVRADSDRHEHDHPARFRTFCLRGWYDHTIDGLGPFEVDPGRSYVMKKGMFHRITRVADGGVWTLVIFGKRDTVWGFKVGERKVPYSVYLSPDWPYDGVPDEERRNA